MDRKGKLGECKWRIRQKNGLGDAQGAVAMGRLPMVVIGFDSKGLGYGA